MRVFAIIAVCCVAVHAAHVQYDACGAVPPLSPLPSQLPAVVQADIESLKSALDDLFQKSGATGGVATLVYDQSQLLTHTFGTTRANGQGVNVSADTVFRIGRHAPLCVSFAWSCPFLASAYGALFCNGLQQHQGVHGCDVASAAGRRQGCPGHSRL